MKEMKQLAEVAQVVPGFAFAEIYQGKIDLPVPFIKVSDFYLGKDSWLSKAANTVDQKILKDLRAKTYPPGTVVFPKVGGALLTNKRARLKVEATFDNNIMGLVPKNIDQDYLYYFMCSFDMARLANTQALPSVRGSDIANIEIPVPLAQEQRRIAARLKAQLAEVEKARKAAEVQLADAEALSAAYLLEVFEGKNFEQWPSVPLGDAGEVVSGITLGRKSKDERLREVPYLRVANVKDGRLDLGEIKTIDATEAEIDKWRLQAGDILLTEGGDPDKLGRGTFWSHELPECIHQNHIYRVRFPAEKYLPEFVSAQIGSPYGKAYFLGYAKQTTGIATINQKVLKAFPLFSPPLEKQKEVMVRLTERMKETGRMVAGIRKRLNEINTLPDRLLAQAFELN